MIRLGGDFKAEFDGKISRLTIHQVYPEDEGEYTCVAYNNLGKVYTSACVLVDGKIYNRNIIKYDKIINTYLQYLKKERKC